MVEVISVDVILVALEADLGLIDLTMQCQAFLGLHIFILDAIPQSFD